MSVKQHRTHERFINQITYGACTPQGDAMTRADEQLMSQLITRVRENLTDANYNVEALGCRHEYVPVQPSSENKGIDRPFSA